MDGKKFIKTGVLSAGTFLLLPHSYAQQQERPPALKDDMVMQFVSKGLSDLTAVKEMLEETSGLINAGGDWGKGDFETALIGASHMGERDIAAFLIQNGARMDIFCAAMLGNLDIVTSMVSTYPAILQSKGPHGITLLEHAERLGRKRKEF